MVPWYGVLGNHDYGYNPTAQTQYKSPNKDRWYLPSLYYTKRIELGNSGQYVTLIMIDTSPCVSDYRGTDQSKWDPCGTEYPGPADCVFHQNILKQNCTIQYNWLKDAIQKIDAKSLKDMGKAMGYLKERYPGQIDFSKASIIVRNILEN